MLDYNKQILASNAFNIVQKDTRSLRLSHAYLFLNADENYLIKFAEKVCNLLLGFDSPELAEKNELRISKRVHPDIKFYGEDKVIDTATVAEIVESAQIAPFEANLKIFVLAGADKLNESAQNKILKTIEEPPKNTYFLLLGGVKSKFLPTILSRVKEVVLENPNLDDLSDMLVASGVVSSKSSIFASLSGGNASFAEKLAVDENFLTLFEKTIDAFLKINGSRDVLNFSSYYSNKSVDKKEFVDIAIIICRDVLMVLAGCNELVMLKSEITKLKMIAASLNLDQTNNLLEFCLLSKQKLESNVNPVSVADGLLFKIAEVKVKCKKLLV